MTLSIRVSLAALRLRLIERIRASSESARRRVRAEARLREPPPPKLDSLREFKRRLYAAAPLDSDALFDEEQGERR